MILVNLTLHWQVNYLYPPYKLNDSVVFAKNPLVAK